MTLPADEVRFAATPNEDRLAELEGLRSFLQDAINMIDARAQEIAAPADRMKKLLTAPDKRAMLLDMAGKDSCIHNWLVSPVFTLSLRCLSCRQQRDRQAFAGLIATEH